MLTDLGRWRDLGEEMAWNGTSVARSVTYRVRGVALPDAIRARIAPYSG